VTISLRVLERLGVAPVARTLMAHDGRPLIIEHFDIDALGVPAYGIEDICCLLGCNRTPSRSTSFTPESMA
jgi:serine/threonine-protein kinase HipA